MKLGVSIGAMVFGAGLVILSFVMVAVPIVHALISAPTLTTPGVVRLHLVQGNDKIYQRTGARPHVGAGLLQRNPVTLGPGDVTVTRVGDGTLPVTRVDPNENITRNNATFTSAVGFTVPATGDYDVNVAAGGQVLISRPLADLVRSRVAWVAGIPVGGLIFLAGVVMLVVGLVRRNRVKRGQVPNG